MATVRAGMAAMAVAALVPATLAQQQHCDHTYDCEFYFNSPTEGLIEWDLSSLCSPTHYSHVETDRLNTSFTFNVCGLSDQQCGTIDPNRSHIPVFGVAVQTYGNNTCALAGEGYPDFTPLDFANAANGGINVTHQAAPQLAGSPTSCAPGPNGEIITRSTKYMMLCDSTVTDPPLVVDYAYEETECQYVLVMRSAAACGTPNAGVGGNCKAPPLPPGLSQECATAALALEEAMIGPEAAFQAVNKPCYDSCPISVPDACTVDCNTGLDTYVAACAAASGTTYSVQLTSTFDPATPGGDARVASIKRYACLANTCTDPEDEAAYNTYSSNVLCGVAGATGQLQSCAAEIQAAVAPSPSAAPSATATPSASATPTSTPATLPTPTPSPSPSPAAPAPASDGGAAAGAVFGVGFGLAFLVFGGWQLSTRMGWVNPATVNPRVRGCLNCDCCKPLVERIRGRGSGEKAAFASSAGGTFTSSAPPPATGGFSSTGASSGGGYQTI